jgi:AraC-like DNA-binding protein
MGQPAVEFWLIDRPVVAMAFDYPSGDALARHRHGRGQLVYASTGVMTVTTDDGTWVVPPQRAVWVPAGIDHEIRMTGQVAMRTLYVRDDAATVLPDGCRVVMVTPLLRELILAAVALPQPYPLGGAEERLVQVMLDELQVMEEAPLHVPAVRDDRLLAIADALQRDTGDERTLDGWSREAGASARTLARLFMAETGMTFAGWRQQLRLARALERLAQGRSVTEIAIELGYGSPSAFTAMFRRALGRTPARYFEGDAARPEA